MFIIRNIVFERTHHNANVGFTHLYFTIFFQYGETNDAIRNVIYTMNYGEKEFRHLFRNRCLSEVDIPNFEEIWQTAFETHPVFINAFQKLEEKNCQLETKFRDRITIEKVSCRLEDPNYYVLYKLKLKNCEKEIIYALRRKGSRFAVFEPNRIEETYPFVYHGWHLELEQKIKDHPSLKLKKMLRGAGF